MCDVSYRSIIYLVIPYPISPLPSDVLNHVLDQQVEVLQSEAETMAAIKSVYLPRYHPDATEAKDVYRLEDSEWIFEMEMMVMSGTCHMSCT